jgi:hypothetical protein
MANVPAKKTLDKSVPEKVINEVKKTVEKEKNTVIQNEINDLTENKKVIEKKTPQTRKPRVNSATKPSSTKQSVATKVPTRNNVKKVTAVTNGGKIIETDMSATITNPKPVKKTTKQEPITPTNDITDEKVVTPVEEGKNSKKSKIKKRKKEKRKIKKRKKEKKI